MYNEFEKKLNNSTKGRVFELALSSWMIGVPGGFNREPICISQVDKPLEQDGSEAEVQYS